MVRAIKPGACDECEYTINAGDEMEYTPRGHKHKVCPNKALVTVNDGDPYEPSCWICGDPWDHGGEAHGTVTGDGLTRYDIVALMAQGGHTWRDG